VIDGGLPGRRNGTFWLMIVSMPAGELAFAR
jgi:hypothetical protein